MAFRFMRSEPAQVSYIKPVADIYGVPVVVGGLDKVSSVAHVREVTFASLFRLLLDFPKKFMFVLLCTVYACICGTVKYKVTPIFPVRI